MPALGGPAGTVPPLEFAFRSSKNGDVSQGETHAAQLRHRGTLRAVIGAQVRTGRYASANEVVRAALTLLEGRERARLAGLEQVRAEIRKGVGSGTAKPADEVFARLERNYAAM